MALSDDVKARVSLVAVASAVVAWDRMKSAPARGDWWAPCPLHGEKTASFHVTEKGGAGGAFHCFGCGASGSVIDFVMSVEGVGFGDAVKRLAMQNGVDTVADPVWQAEVRRAAETRQRDAEAEAQRHAEVKLGYARDIWRAARSDDPRLAAYLEGRGVRLDLIGGVPATLRLHADLSARDPRGNELHRGPAMVAAIGRDKLIGVHRTWIDADDPSRGRARMSDGSKVPKQMLGRTGEIFGMPVKLTAPGGPFLMVGEGIETTLAALAAAIHALPPDAPRPSAEAALTLGAMAGPGLDSANAPRCPRSGKAIPSATPDPKAARPGWLPPAGTARAVVLADPSTKSPATAQAMAERACAKIAARCTDGARLAIPAGHWDHDDDFADLAKKGTLYER